MDEQVIKHAQSVARQLVSLGYVDKEAARGHFKDYLLYLNLGFQGNFAQILHARRVIDDRGLSLLNERSPSPAAVARQEAEEEVGMTSMVIQLPKNLPRATPPKNSPSLASRGLSSTAPPLRGSGFGRAPARPRGGGFDSQGADPPPASGRTNLHAEALTASPELTLPLPGFEPPPSAERAPLAEDPSLAAGRSQEDLLAFEFPSARPVKPRAPRPRPSQPAAEAEDTIPTQIPGQSDEDSRPEGTLILPEDEIRPGARADIIGVSTSSRGFSVTPIPTGSASKDYDPIAGDWASQSTPSLDSGTRAPDDTGDVFWRSESGEEHSSPFLEPKVGGYMGEFELLEILGQGGMGVVFKVRHQGTDRIFGLKVLRVRKGAKTETRRRRFRTEVQAMQRLTHDNIVGVHGYGRDGPFDWYVMDYVEGKDLAALLRAQALSDPQKLKVFDQICDSIVHAHERGVVHRDLKPQNVLVDANLHVTILDFGLAKLLDEEDGLTHTGSALGTPFYMSPEQISSPRSVGPQADVFALGVMLYEIMTGQRPFTGHSAGEVGNKILTVDPPLPTKVNPKVHANIDAICAKAMEKSVERRYRTAGALHEDLRQHLKGKSLRGESQTVAVARRWVERNRSGFVGGLFVAALVLGLLAVVAFMLWLVVD